jgi:predicted dehydrogenase
MLRGAFLGFGNVAVYGHVPGWLKHSDVEFVAVSDTNESRRPEAERLLPRARWYDSAEALLAEERLDFVDICTPPTAHVSLIRAALQRGLHVLCEKPLVCRFEDLAEVSALAADMRKVLYTVHNWHHSPIVEFIRDLLHRHEIGSISRCVWQTLRTKPAPAADGQASNWRLDPSLAGGGVLIDHGWHACYVIHSWLGQNPDAVSAQIESRRHGNSLLEDTATVHIRYPRATAEMFLTWAADERRNVVELTGDRGTIRVENDCIVLSPVNLVRGERRWRLGSSLSEGSHHPEWFGGVATGFLSEITDHTMRGRNLAEAALCLDVLALARSSSGQACAWLPVPGPITALKTDMGALR